MSSQNSRRRCENTQTHSVETTNMSRFKYPKSVYQILPSIAELTRYASLSLYLEVIVHKRIHNIAENKNNGSAWRNGSEIRLHDGCKLWLENTRVPHVTGCRKHEHSDKYWYCQESVALAVSWNSTYLTALTTERVYVLTDLNLPVRYRQTGNLVFIIFTIK